MSYFFFGRKYDIFGLSSTLEKRMIMVDVLYNIVELLKHLCIYVLGFNMQLTSKPGRKVIVAGLTVGIGILMHFYNDISLFPVLGLGYVLGSSYLLLSSFSWKRAMIVIWSIGVIASVDTVSYVIIKLICRYLGLAYIEIYDLVGSLITLLLLWFLFYFIRRKSKVVLQEPSAGFCITFLIICFINVYILVIFEKDIPLASIKYTLVYIMLIIGSLMQMAFLLLSTTINNWHQENERMKEQYLNLQNEHYQYLEQKNIETRKFRHDMRQHLYAMKEYIRVSKWEELDNYIDSIAGKLEHVPDYISVQNDIVDAILNYYYKQFKEKEVAFKVVGNMPEQCQIAAYDLCTIFSNILSNALEAVAKTEEKRVELTIRSEKEMLFLLERNTFDGNIEREGDILLTSKDNKEIHGFGVCNIQDSVKKYGGELRYEVRNREYVLSIVMENRECLETVKNRL